MSEPRAVRVAKIWKRLLCDPRGTLTADGKAILRDLAEFCYAAKPICIRDTAGRIDPLATQHALGRQEAYLRIAGMLGIDMLATVRMAYEMPHSDGEAETTFPG